MLKIFLSQLNPTVGDIQKNKEALIEALIEAKQKGADLLVSSELALTGYPPLDLLFAPGFVEKVESALLELLPYTKGLLAVIGAVRKNPSPQGKALYNSAFILQDGHLVATYDKRLLPTYDVFDETRYFQSGEKPLKFIYKNYHIAVTICEDIWQHAKAVEETHYKEDPIVDLKESKTDLLINLSASPYYFDKWPQRLNILAQAAKTLSCPAILCNQVGANDGLIFDGQSFGVDKEGSILFRAKGFEEDRRMINLNIVEKLLPRDPEEEQIKALTLGITDYFHKLGFSRALIGLSGGIDSAFVLKLAVLALGKDKVQALFMPSIFTSKQSYEDAAHMAKILGVTMHTIPIDSMVKSFNDPLSSMSDSLVKENLQARVRALLLMAYSNHLGALVINTSNKSELAMGYSTLYGDSIGAISPLGDLYKSEVFNLAKKITQIPPSILTKAPSAELKENQKDSDTLPEYDILDPILKGYLEDGKSCEKIASDLALDPLFIKTIIKNIYQNEYKRKQSPLILKISKKGLTPLIGRVIPTVQKFI